MTKLTCIRHTLVLVLIAAAGDLLAQDSLKILSWNIQMIPMARSNSRIIRARAIVNQLKKMDYDVIIFQELFQNKSRKVITKGIKDLYPYCTRVLNKKSIAFKTNGGVIIFSKYPLNDVHEIRFSRRKGFDRLSRKGAILATLDVNGKLIQVGGTHLQAFGTEEILYSQYDQIAKQLLDPNLKPGIPQLLCGDFNTLKALPPKLPDGISQDFINRLPRYHVMLKTLGAEDGELLGDQQFTMDRPFNDLCTTRKDIRLLLDYSLLRMNGRTVGITRQVKIIRQQWDETHQDLSDHFALETILTGF